jgi:hypothetical protein
MFRPAASADVFSDDDATVPFRNELLGFCSVYGNDTGSKDSDPCTSDEPRCQADEHPGIIRKENHTPHASHIERERISQTPTTPIVVQEIPGRFALHQCRITSGAQVST